MNTPNTPTPKCAMQPIGTDIHGRQWFFADNSFTRPGVYYWNGKDNIHAGDYIDQLERELAKAQEAAGKVEQGLSQALRATTEQRDGAREALRELRLSYIDLLHTGRNRIVELGGDCDPVEMMIARDTALAKAREVVGL